MSFNQKHDEQRRMTSITRKLHWYMLRGKILHFLGADILLGILMTGGWCLEQEYALLGNILEGNRRSFERVTTAAEPGFDLIYRIVSKEGTPLLSVSCLIPFAVIASVIIALLILQLLGVIFSYYREDRTIRKILAPINEIALKADELSRLSFTEDKYQVIEDAIEHIHPEQAERLSINNPS